MKLDKADIEQLQASCSMYWWNHGKKKLSAEGTLAEVLKENNIVITKKPRPGHADMFIYTCKFNIGSQDVVIKQPGNAYNIVELGFKALIYTMVYLGDKSKIYCKGMEKTFNF